jgi:hypothetical protein
MKPRCSRCPVSVVESSRVLIEPERGRRWEGPLDMLWFVSLEENSLDKVVEVF